MSGETDERKEAIREMAISAEKDFGEWVRKYKPCLTCEAFEHIGKLSDFLISLTRKDEESGTDLRSGKP